MPIFAAIGLILAIYPCLAKVKFESAKGLIHDTQVLSLTLAQNWLIGPLVMFFLAALFLKHYPQYAAGVMLLGIARSISPVIVWNDLAEGDREFCAGIVSINAVFQLFTYSSYAWLFLTILPPAFGMRGTEIYIPFMLVAGIITAYLGIPLLAAVLSRRYLIKRKGKEWYENILIPRLDQLKVIALTFTILWIFSSYDHHIARSPLDALRVGGVLFLYHAIMFLLSFYQAARAGAEYDKTFTFAFTSSTNNFPLAIATAAYAFGPSSKVAFACAIGALLEFPVMLIFVPLARQLSCKIVELLPAATIEE